MRLVPLAVVLLLGCGERSAPTGAAATPPEASPASGAPRVATPVDLARRSAKIPPPTPMPSGGGRIDMSNTLLHVRTLERQPDGKYRQACIQPSAAAARAQGTK